MQVVAIILAFGLVLGACAKQPPSADMCRGVSGTIGALLDIYRLDPTAMSEADKKLDVQLKPLLPRLRERYGESGFSGEVFDAVGRMKNDELIPLAHACLADRG